MRSSHAARTGAGALLGLALLCQGAQAAPGYLNQGMNLRAGPGVDYPLIAPLPPGTQTEIFGCLPGWGWCDVATSGLRGWVAGVGLQVLYENQPEPLASYGPEIGLPVVGFDFGNYWGRHYRGRPWFSEVDRWHGPGGPRDDRGGPPGQPYGDGRDGRGGFGGYGGRGPEGGGPGGFTGPGRGPGGFQGGQPGGFGGPARSGPPGFNRGNEPGGQQPQARFQGGAPAGGGPGRGGMGPGPGQQQGPRPGGGAQHGPQGPAPDHGGPGQHDPR